MGFPRCNTPTAGFSVHGMFSSQPMAKTLPAWVMALLGRWLHLVQQCVSPALDG